MYSDVFMVEGLTLSEACLLHGGSIASQLVTMVITVVPKAFERETATNITSA